MFGRRFEPSPNMLMRRYIGAVVTWPQVKLQTVGRHTEEASKIQDQALETHKEPGNPHEFGEHPSHENSLEEEFGEKWLGAHSFCRLGVDKKLNKNIEISPLLKGGLFRFQTYTRLHIKDLPSNVARNLVTAFLKCLQRFKCCGDPYVVVAFWKVFSIGKAVVSSTFVENQNKSCGSEPNGE